MNKKNCFFIFLISLFISGTCQVHAQSITDWQPIYLTPGGGNTIDGVEASFQVNTCNGEDIIYLKYFNHNEYAVKLEWFDAIFTQELKWINNEQPDEKKSLQLRANKGIVGECSNNLYPELVIKVKKFVADKKDVKRYLASRLIVVKVQ